MSNTKTVATGYKVANRTYTDLSDYARPAAIQIAQRLHNTPIHVYHITITHFAIALLAAFLISRGGFLLTLTAAIALMIKNVLDAVDGSLARIRNRPSRVGRFLDSDLDFVGNFFLFFALVDIPIWMRIVSFLSFLIQGSFFNYFYILFRNSYGGDTTSKIKEDDSSIYRYDNPTALRMLYFFYSLFYRWQDKFVTFIDHYFRTQKRTISPVFISLLSIHGLGFQYLAIIILLLIGRQQLIPIWFSILMNLYLITLLLMIWRNPLDLSMNIKKFTHKIRFS